MDSLKGMIATAVMAGVVLLPAATVQADGMLFDAATPYSSFNDSPLFSFANTAGNSFWLENFEDGLSNTAGLSLNTGEIRTPSQLTDSVDFDDGVLDGLGQRRSFVVHQSRDHWT